MDSIKILNANIEQLLNQSEKPLTIEEATSYLGISKSYLYKLTSQHAIAHFKPGGKKIYFKKTDLNSYLFNNRKLSTNELEQKAIEYVVKN